VAFEASLQDVARLRAAAQQVNASSAMMFFSGLHSLLTVVAQRRVFLAATRVESVKVRLHAMGGWSMAEPSVPQSISCFLPAIPEFSVPDSHTEICRDR
jgi:hypothetical protein